MIGRILTDREAKILIDSTRKRERVIKVEQKNDVVIADGLEKIDLVEVRACSPYIFRVRATGAGRRYAEALQS